MLWLILSVLLWGLFHSLLASLPAKGLVRRWLGNQAMRFYRLAYNLFACISFLPVLVVAALTPDKSLYFVQLPWSVLMVLGELVAVVVLIIGFVQTDVLEFLGFRQVNDAVEDRRGQLVTSGLYRFVRHPLYSAGLLFIWLLPLMTANVLAINIGLTIYVIIGAFFKERKMRFMYGQEYASYAAHTPMFVPFLKGNKTPRQTS